MSFEWVDDDMVQSLCGGVAQLGERLPCTQEVIGSNPFTSTRKALHDWVFLFFDNLDVEFKLGS